MKLLLGLFVTSMIFLGMSSHAFAQTNYDVNIPTGAASPDAPYFWQSEIDGDTSGIVEITIGDSITWKNADSAAHTVTSGTPTAGPDNIFDSGLYGPGKSFSHKFDEIGFYPYFCLVHPWMDGAVIAINAYSLIPNVGKNVGDGATTFNVEYDFNRVLSSAMVDEEQKSITFQIIGNAQSNDHDLELRLPTQLIDGPFVIWADGEKITNFESERDGDLSTLYIPLTSESEKLTIVGTTVVPEFGTIAMLILLVSILSVMIFSKTRPILMR